MLSSARVPACMADDSINPWAVRLFQTFSPFDPRTAREGSAYDKWLDERSDRENARGDRVHGAVGVIPTTLWVVLFLIAGIIFVFTLFFADSGERAVVQGLLMGSVVASIVSLMLLLHALDRPFTTDVGGLRPVAMERTLRQIDTTLGDLGRTVRPPCDAEGRPARG